MYRIWSTDWFHDSVREFEKLLLFIDALLKVKLAEREKQDAKGREVIAELEKAVKSSLINNNGEQTSLF